MKRGRIPLPEEYKRKKIMISISPEAAKKVKPIMNNFRSKFIDYAILKTKIPKNIPIVKNDKSH